MKRLCEATGLQGHHNMPIILFVTAATQLFETGIDEQLTMQHIDHSTTAGTRSYKRIGEKLRSVTSDVHA